MSANPGVHWRRKSSSAASFKTVIRIKSRDHLSEGARHPYVHGPDELPHAQPRVCSLQGRDDESNIDRSEDRVDISRKTSAQRFSHPYSALHLPDFVQTSESTVRNLPSASTTVATDILSNQTDRVLAIPRPTKRGSGRYDEALVATTRGDDQSSQPGTRESKGCPLIRPHSLSLPDSVQDPQTYIPNATSKVCGELAGLRPTHNHAMNMEPSLLVPIPNQDGPAEEPSQTPSGKRLHKRNQRGAYKPIHPTDLDLTPRDWSPFRKAFVAVISCCNVAVVGAVIGLYSGMVS